jgi:hypothetical protein
LLRMQVHCPVLQCIIVSSGEITAPPNTLHHRSSKTLPCSV